MAYVLVHQTVQDFDAWKPSFEEGEELRREHGSQGGHVFRSSEDPNQVTILFEWDSHDAAREFSRSDELREARKRAGVTDSQIRFLEKVEEIPG